jgi:hypothetical protein
MFLTSVLAIGAAVATATMASSFADGATCGNRVAASATLDSRGWIMPWMCLERCGFNASDIDAQIASLVENSCSIRAVSFEWFDLGPNGTLTNNGFTQVASRLKAHNFTTVAMVTTANLTKMRDLWSSKATTLGFLEALDNTLAAAGDIDGVNFDWEPPAPPTPTSEDGLNYANFLGTARKVLGSGKSKAFISVDIGLWSAVWNWTAIRDALGDHDDANHTSSLPKAVIVPMSTYTYDPDLFGQRLQLIRTIFHATGERVTTAVGLDTWAPGPDQLNATVVSSRLQLIKAAGFCQIGIWQLPLPDAWWPLLAEFAQWCGFYAPAK